MSASADTDWRCGLRRKWKGKYGTRVYNEHTVHGNTIHLSINGHVVVCTEVENHDEGVGIREGLGYG